MILSNGCKPHTIASPPMKNSTRSFAQLMAATALMIGTTAFCIVTPSSRIPEQHRPVAGFLVLVGCVLAPAGLIIGAARDAQY